MLTPLPTNTMFRYALDTLTWGVLDMEIDQHDEVFGAVITKNQSGSTKT